MSDKRSGRVGLIILFAGIVFGLVIASSFNFTKPTISSLPVQPPKNLKLGSQEEPPEALLKLQNTSDAFIYIAEMVVPTVVTIRSTRLVSAADMKQFHDRDDIKDFFRFRIPREFRQQGAGSGILVSDDGYILTNVHVVDESDNIRVILSDNREFDATIVGLDPLTEVAVIKIKAKNLPVAKLGNSDQVKVGEWVLAIGNPLELESTVTAGIISAKERQINIIHNANNYDVEIFLQTDAAINPGNSGGALVNLKGEVIGVNTAIATETGYNAGFGFAIPINLAKKIMTDLIYKGKVNRGYLGIAMQNIDEKIAKGLGLERPMGVFISQVMAEESAGRAGIKPKDVLLKVAGQEVSRSNQVQAIIARKSPGESVRIELLRKGKVIKLDVVLGLRDAEETLVAEVKQKNTFDNLGLEVDNLTRKKAKELGYSGIGGVRVEGVERWSPAEDAGIREDDIIWEIDETIIQSKNDFYDFVSKLETGNVSIFTLKRMGKEFYVFVEIPDE